MEQIIITPENVEAMSLVEDAMKVKGMTRADLARATGYSRAHISQLLNLRKPATPQTTLLLQHAVGLVKVSSKPAGVRKAA